MTSNTPVLDRTCFVCGATSGQLVEALTSKPSIETDFGIAEESYYREILRCDQCDVFYSVHGYNTDEWYTGKYNAATYADQMQAKYASIRSMPYERSDNKHRVKRVAAFCADRWGRIEGASSLDIGSGLAVFSGEMSEAGFSCYCLDPDSSAIEHAKAHAGVVDGFAGTLDSFQPMRLFDMISLNKVLEHVRNPVSMLSSAGAYLSDRGVVYLEVPDGQAALQHGALVDREEFCIEHYTIFTPIALSRLIELSGFRVVEQRSIHEPSDKYTLYAFVQKT